MIDLDQAERFIELLTGRPDSSVTLQVFDDSKTRADKRLAAKYTGSVRKFRGALSRANDNGCGIFVQINEGARGAANVTAARACFADDDGLTTAHQVGQACPACGRAHIACDRCDKLHTSDTAPLITLPPTIVVQTSLGERNRHYYWRLAAPTPALDQWVETQRVIACVLRTDPTMKSLDRVMRLPGTLNRKIDPKAGRTGDPYPVTIVESVSGRTYTLSSIAGYFASRERDSGPIGGVAVSPIAASAAATVDALPALDDIDAVGALPSLDSLPTDGDDLPSLDDDDQSIVIDFARGQMSTPDGATLQPPRSPTNEEDVKPSRLALKNATRLRSWLKRQTVEFDERRNKKHPLRFLLRKCAFNPDHLDVMEIRVHPVTGGFSADCFHHSCGAHRDRWDEVREKIGGWGIIGDGFRFGSEAEISHRAQRDVAAGTDEELVYDDGCLWRYSPISGIYGAIDKAALSRIIQDYDGRRIGDGGKRLLVGRGTITGAIGLLHDRVAQPGFFQGAVPGIAFTNGFVSVRGRNVHLEPFAPALRARATLPFAYDPFAASERFQQFLDEIFSPDLDREEKKMLLQEIAGASLLGIAPRYETGVFLLGTGANGKSTVLRLIKTLFPANTVASVRPQDLEDPQHRARLVGVRLNLVTEVPNKALNTGAYKAVVSGEIISAKNPYVPVFEFAPIAAQWFALNDLPPVSDLTFGFFRKVAILWFNRKFEGANDDKDLASYLIEHELAGIAAWAVAGASRLVKQGQYTQPASSQAAKNAWRSTADMVMLFIDECCTHPRGGMLPVLAVETEVGELYEHFRAWARDSNRPQVPHKQEFGKRLKALGFQPRESNGNTIYPIVVHAPPPTSSYM